MSHNLIFIVGLQKSGTSLLRRVLTTVPGVQHPFHGEGSDFWGNVPPFSPTGHPAGTIYQKSGGENGHVASRHDATAADASILQSRLNEMTSEPGPIVNKNPFNSVRIDWLKQLFPSARIVAIYRLPVPAIYSLSKKFVAHEHRGKGPEDGWWGVKPSGWQSMVSTDIHQQLAAQWNGVNEAILASLHQVDHLIRYDDFCQSPRHFIKSILAGANFELDDNAIDIVPGQLRCQDHEYRQGSRLLSRNRDFVASGHFEINADCQLEHPALDDEEVVRLTTLTQAMTQKLNQVRQHAR